MISEKIIEFSNGLENIIEFIVKVECNSINYLIKLHIDKVVLIEYTFDNTKYVLKIFKEMNGMALIKCRGCGADVSENAQACPKCGEPINTSIKCPKCGSKDTSVISGASKVASVAMFGVFAANKVLSKNKCNKCGHKF
ncbi:MAG: zinc ribbon domain-containing protein [Eubacteriales bacterium]